MITVLPLSPAAGVYVNENGVPVTDDGFTAPAPFSVIVTLVALPPKVFSETVTGIVPHVLPFSALNTRRGGFIHPQETAKMVPTVVQPCIFRTAMTWFPLSTPANEVPV